MTNQLKKLGVLGSNLKPATLRILAASVLVTGLAGCAHRLETGHAEGFVAPGSTVEERHPIEIEKARANLALQVGGDSGGLNVYQRDRVRHFIAIWRNEGAGKIVVSGNSHAALADLRDLLIERVVPVGAVQVVRFDGGQPGVKLSFARYVAEGPKCGHWRTNLADDSANTEQENFGCADQHNLAALIANPKDLVMLRDQVDWSNADRSDFMFRAFTFGKGTSADTTAIDRSGTISDVAKH